MDSNHQLDSRLKSKIISYDRYNLSLMVKGWKYIKEKVFIPARPHRRTILINDIVFEPAFLLLTGHRGKNVGRSAREINHATSYCVYNTTILLSGECLIYSEETVGRSAREIIFIFILSVMVLCKPNLLSVNMGTYRDENVGRSAREISLVYSDNQTGKNKTVKIIAFEISCINNRRLTVMISICMFNCAKIVLLNLYE